jgi:hypothetical protein
MLDPLHPANVGVTDMVELIAEVLVFVAVKFGTLTVPLAARPIEVLLLVLE